MAKKHNTSITLPSGKTIELNIRQSLLNALVQVEEDDGLALPAMINRALSVYAQDELFFERKYVAAPLPTPSKATVASTPSAETAESNDMTFGEFADMLKGFKAAVLADAGIANDSSFSQAEIDSSIGYMDEDFHV